MTLFRLFAARFENWHAPGRLCLSPFVSVSGLRVAVCSEQVEDEQ
jgi:hypothetical protein